MNNSPKRLGYPISCSKRFVPVRYHGVPSPTSRQIAAVPDPLLQMFPGLIVHMHLNHSTTAFVSSHHLGPPIRCSVEPGSRIVYYRGAGVWAVLKYQIVVALCPKRSHCKSWTTPFVMMQLRETHHQSRHSHYPTHLIAVAVVEFANGAVMMVCGTKTGRTSKNLVRTDQSSDWSYFAIVASTHFASRIPIRCLTLMLRKRRLLHQSSCSS